MLETKPGVLARIDLLLVHVSDGPMGWEPMVDVHSLVLNHVSVYVQAVALGARVIDPVFQYTLATWLGSSLSHTYI